MAFKIEVRARDESVGIKLEVRHVVVGALGPQSDLDSNSDSATN